MGLAVIREVPGSNLISEIDCPEVFLVFLPSVQLTTEIVPPVEYDGFQFTATNHATIDGGNEVKYKAMK